MEANSDAIDSLAKTADKLGVTTEALQTLRYQGELTGVSIDTTDMALQRMTRRVAEAAQGTGEAKDAIAELGLEASSLANMSPDQQFYAIADAMKDIENQGDRVRLAMKLFDSEGVALVNTLVSDLDAAEAKFASLGATITREQAAIVESYNDTKTNLEYLFGAFGEKMTVYLAGPFDELLQYIEDLAIEMGGMDGVARTVASAFIDAFAAIIDGIAEVINALNEAKLSMNGVNYAWQQQKGNFGAFLDQFGIDYGEELMESALSNMAALDEEGKNIVASMSETQAKADSLRQLAERMRSAVDDAVGAGSSSSETSTAVSPVAADEIAANSAAYQQMLAQYDEQYAAQLKHEEQLAKINALEITEAERKRLLAEETERYNESLQKLTDTQNSYNSAVSASDARDKVLGYSDGVVSDRFSSMARMYQSSLDSGDADKAQLYLQELKDMFQDAASTGLAERENYDMDAMRTFIEQASSGENQQLLIQSQDVLTTSLNTLNESITNLSQTLFGAESIGSITINLSTSSGTTSGSVTGDTSFLKTMADVLNQAKAKV